MASFMVAWDFGVGPSLAGENPADDNGGWYTRYGPVKNVDWHVAFYFFIKVIILDSKRCF